MRYFTLLSLVVTTAVHAQSDTLHVLFLGNSYTASNGLPTVLAELAADLGTVVAWQSNAPGGATLQGHVSNPTSNALIEAGGWDWVILQEQSQIPSFPDNQVQADFFPAATSLVEAIRAADPCAIPLFYMTWGRENGDASNCAVWPPVCTYEGMQALLTQRYLEAADLSDAWCAPVGMVWQQLRETTAIDLYSSDGSHPSAAGTYVAASTMAAALLGTDPAAASYGGNIDAAERALIDAAVWSMWQSEPEAWKQFDYADFDLSIEPLPAGALVTLDANPYLDSVVVDSGWESFTLVAGASVTFTFTEPVTLAATAFGPCAPAETTTFVVQPTAIAEQERAVRLFPNPADGYAVLNGVEAGTAWELRNALGSVVQERRAAGSAVRFETGALPAGWYVVRAVGTSGGPRVFPLLVEH